MLRAVASVGTSTPAGSRQPPTSLTEQSTIPIRLRVGVTGHRRLPDAPELPDRVRDAIDRVLQLAQKVTRSPVLLEVVSPLGEGADQLVAREALRRTDATLEVPLPMPRERYLAGFNTDAGRAAFDVLHDRASASFVVSRQEDEELAYRDVGR